MQTVYPIAPFRTEAMLRVQAAELFAHPRFHEVRRDYTRKLSDYQEASRTFAKLIANEDRYRALNFFFSLWAENVAAGGDGSITYGEMHEICRRGEVSPRVLKTMLSLGVFTKFLTRTPNPRDGRSWLYAPTPRMIAFPLLWLMPAAEALDELQPRHGRAALLRDDPALLVYFFRSGGREFASGLQPMTIQGEFMTFFGHKEGGAALTIGLLLADLEGTPPPSRAELAQRYGMSKSQVNQLVAFGEELGLVVVSNGVPAATAKLRDAHSEWVSLSLAFLGHHLLPPEPEGR